MHIITEQSSPVSFSLTSCCRCSMVLFSPVEPELAVATTTAAICSGCRVPMAERVVSHLRFSVFECKNCKCHIGNAVCIDLSDEASINFHIAFIETMQLFKHLAIIFIIHTVHWNFSFSREESVDPDLEQKTLNVGEAKTPR